MKHVLFAAVMMLTFSAVNAQRESRGNASKDRERTTTERLKKVPVVLALIKLTV